MREKHTDLDRKALIERLKNDADILIDGDMEHRKQVLKDYVSKVKITNDTIEILCIGDLTTTGGATQIWTGE